MANLPDIIYIPKEGVDAFGAQSWFREMPNGIPYIRVDKINK